MVEVSNPSAASTPVSPAEVAAKTAAPSKLKGMLGKSTDKKAKPEKSAASKPAKTLKPSESSGGFLSRLPFFRQKENGKHMRAYNRHPCCIIAELSFPEKNYKLEGLVIELSQGGVLFREATTYILDREGEPIQVLVGDQALTGRIVNVSPKGYGIKLEALMPETQVTHLLSFSSAKAMQAMAGVSPTAN